ncbi:hypothetical protein CS063_07680 [Sporanaerobium hydrogeniformans]|uniref:Uncharacterized protein n=1 Tax=Sporanaerobium hydrogeniformans TaxID=3072179 RepID=A0AC61DD83_9FIRM|nr:dTDP-4-amino-4,6-dideoxyglucose formyltransferase [Sporanaerobium hydrogeniformans]PHV70895.1 hypothetical protein CS063_07680 [Sporanaerobium hydrogeniformans]
MKKILVISDSLFLLQNFYRICEERHYNKEQFDIRFCASNKAFLERYKGRTDIGPISIKESVEAILKTYDLVLSLHCNDKLPAILVNQLPCVNLHPGYNPCNRGKFPYVFSILNKKALGVTLHLMDEELDHGPIIVRKKLEIEAWDTMDTLYDKLLQLEVEVLEAHIESLLNGTFTTFLPEEEGNINYAKDFHQLKALDLEQEMTLGEAIDLLRALTHKDINNAYFYDSKKNKVFVKIFLDKEN